MFLILRFCRSISPCEAHLQLSDPTKVSLHRCLPQSTEMSDSLMDMEGPRQLGQLAPQSKPAAEAEDLTGAQVWWQIIDNPCH